MNGERIGAVYWNDDLPRAPRILPPYEYYPPPFVLAGKETIGHRQMGMLGFRAVQFRELEGVYGIADQGDGRGR